MTKTKAIALVVLASVLFGALPLFVNRAYDAGFNTFDVLFFRFLFAVAVFFVLLRRKRISLAITRRQGMVLLVSGIIGYVVMSSTLFLSYKYISSGLATSIHFMYPMIATVAAFFLYKQKLRPLGIAALFLGVGGVFLVSVGSYTLENVLGLVLAAASAVAFAAYAISIAHPDLKDMPTEKLLFYVSCITVVVIFLGELCFGTTPFARANAATLGWSAVIALFCTVLALAFFTLGVKAMGPATACILSTLEPVTSIVLGALFLDEHLQIYTLFGCLLVIVSVVMISLSSQKKELPTPEEST